MSKSKKLVGAFICVASIVGVGGSAFAGEVTGSGKGGPSGDGTTGARANSNSECAFSGQEDHDGEGATPGSGEVQNWGHVKPFLVSIGAPVTGAAGPIVTPEGVTGCNGHNFGRK